MLWVRSGIVGERGNTRTTAGPQPNYGEPTLPTHLPILAAPVTQGRSSTARDASPPLLGTPTMNGLASRHHHVLRRCCRRFTPSGWDEEEKAEAVGCAADAFRTSSIAASSSSASSATPSSRAICCCLRERGRPLAFGARKRCTAEKYLGGEDEEDEAHAGNPTCVFTSHSRARFWRRPRPRPSPWTRRAPGRSGSARPSSGRDASPWRGNSTRRDNDRPPRPW